MEYRALDCVLDEDDFNLFAGILAFLLLLLFSCLVFIVIIKS